MKVQAMVLGPVNTKYIAKDKAKHGHLTPAEVKGLPAADHYIFHTLNVIDMEAPGSLQKTLILDVHENDFTEAQTLAGKTAILNVYFAENRKGDLRSYFGGRHSAVQQQKAA